MTRVLKNEYLEFLQTYDLLSKFFKVLLGVANQISASPDEFLVSSLLLEIKADYLRETVMSAKNLSAGEKEQDGGGSIFSSEDGSQFFLSRSEKPEDNFHFKTKMVFGPEQGKFYEGKIVEGDLSNQGGIFLIPSSKLVKPNKQTMKVLNLAKYVITDSEIDFDEFMKTLKQQVRQEISELKNAAATTYIVVNTSDEVKKISQIIKTGSDLKNTEISDRGYFLGSILQNADQPIWDKVNKNAFKKKFAAIGADVTYEEVSTVWGTQILAEMIETACGQSNQEESFMLQISMSETFEKIRSGQFIGQSEENKEADIEDKTHELQRQMSDKLSGSI